MLAVLVFGPILCGILSCLIGRKKETFRDIFVILATACFLVLSLFLWSGRYTWQIPGILAMDLTFTTDGFRGAYAIITALMWAGTSAFAKEYFAEEREGLNRYWFFNLVTLGATEGVMLSGDLMTAFIFFEILSFTSFTWVIHEETKEAIRAGYTYLFIAVTFGLVLFMGLVILRHELGTLSFAQLKEAAANCPNKKTILAAGICVLLGFGAKAGMYPLHVWLPKAHPVAPSPASALLSGILTKVGVYGILMMTMQVFMEDQTFGLLVLILGVITMALGAVLALCSVNLKRTLACSSMSQIGFILTGVGMMVLLSAQGEEEGVVLATSGLMLHMVNHSLIKLVLFMVAGVVVMNLHQLDLNQIRGWGRNKTPLKIMFLLGALGISGMPLFNGYISKTLLHEGIVEGAHAIGYLSGMLHAVEWIFLISGGLTFAYMLKLFICLFAEKNTDVKIQRQFDSDQKAMNGLSTVTIGLSSLFMVILGQPAVMKRLAFHMTGMEEIMHFQAFSWTNLKGGLISLGIGALVYVVIVRHLLMRQDQYINIWPQKLDLEDLIYRPLMTKILPAVFGTIASVFGENKILRPLCKAGVWIGTFFGRILDSSTDAVIVFLRKTVMRERKVRGEEGHPGLFGTLYRESKDTVGPIVSNFTFAMMMTCIGILIVLLAIIVTEV